MEERLPLGVLMMVLFFRLDNETTTYKHRGYRPTLARPLRFAHLITYAALIVDLGPFGGLPFIEETNGSQELFPP